MSYALTGSNLKRTLRSLIRVRYAAKYTKLPISHPYCLTLTKKARYHRLNIR